MQTRSQLLYKDGLDFLKYLPDKPDEKTLLVNLHMGIPNDLYD